MSSLKDRTDPGKILRIPTPKVYLPLLKRLDQLRYIGIYGGRAGGKSHHVAEMIIERALMNRYLRVVVVREYAVSTKHSFMQLLEDKILEWGVSYAFRILENIIHIRDVKTRRDAGKIIFRGLQTFNATSIKSLEGFDLGVVDEGQEISHASWQMFYPTLRKPGSQIWVIWNPNLPTDAVDAFFRSEIERDDLMALPVLWSDNPFLSDESRKDMEFDKARDLDTWLHVWQGGYNLKSKARVFSNYRQGKPGEVEAARARAVANGDTFYYGGDFGFATDPSVLVEMFIHDRTLFISDEAYGHNVEMDYLPFLFGGCEDYPLQKIAGNDVAWAAMDFERKKDWRGIPGARKWPITADCARPETIDYLARHGFPLIGPARKGPGSVEDGIEHLKRFDIVIHPTKCPHTFDEMNTYSYKVDKKSGKVLPVLDDKKNHVIDSARYGLEDERAPQAGMF